MNAFEEQEYTKQFDLNLWIKLFGFVKLFKKNLIALIVSAIIIASIDASFPLFTKFAIDNFIGKKTFDGMPLFITIFFITLSFQAFNVWLFIMQATKIEIGVVYEIRKAGFKKLQALSFSYFDTTPVGWIMARMTSDAQKLADIVAWGSLDIIWGIAIVIFIMISMLILNFKLALITLSVIPVLVFVSVFFQKRILSGQREVRKINSKITAGFNEGITGAKTTKTLIREEENLEEFQHLTRGMYKSSVRVATISSIYLPLVLMFGSIGTALTLVYGGHGVLLNTIHYGTLVVFISYAMQIFDPISQLARVIADFQSAQASAERTLSLLDTELEIKDAEEVKAIYGDESNPKKENWEKIQGDIEFKNVTFCYKNGEKVLENFNLKIKSGEKIALVGETGSGKSTIVNLICRFYEPTSGEILIDGVDYRKRSQIWLQSNLGYVLQTPHLFSGSIKENIRYGKLEATDEEVIKAAKTVNFDEFVSKFEDGFDTDVGEGGGKLSTGEKQLISFARAIIGNPSIFVLDEATSSVDTETEQIVQKAIETVLKGRTSFIIAHRLSTIRSADRILVIKNGKILEEGSHNKLLKQKGYYYNLYTNQFKEEEESKLLK